MQKGGGILIAVGLLGGAAIGTLLGQSSAGLMIGLGLGVAGAVLIALLDARKRG